MVTPAVPGHLIGTNISVWRLEHPSAAKRERFLGNEKVRDAEREARSTPEGPIRRLGRTEWRREQGVGAIILICWMQGGTWSAQGESQPAGVL
jgi:hypothetical protein